MMENFNEILEQIITSQYAQLVSVNVNGEANWGEACAMDEDDMKTAMAEIGYDTEGMISGQMYLDLFVEKRLSEIVEVVHGYGDFAEGDNLIGISQEWYDEDFTAAEVDAWLEAGVFTADAAAELRDADVSPESVSGTDAATLGHSVDSVGYKFANGDISLEQVISAIAATA